jgi:hypothetical protein
MNWESLICPQEVGMGKRLVVGLVLAAICLGILAATVSHSVTCPFCGKEAFYQHADVNAWFYVQCVQCKKDFKFEVKNGVVVKVEKIQECPK